MHTGTSDNFVSTEMNIFLCLILKMSNIFHISLKTQPLSIDKFDIFRAACTYCGGDVEDEFTNGGLLSACLLFPIGNNLRDN